MRLFTGSPETPAPANEALSQADRFALDPGLTELDPADRAALKLPEH